MLGLDWTETELRLTIPEPDYIRYDPLLPRCGYYDTMCLLISHFY